jgi:hypothetical protein
VEALGAVEAWGSEEGAEEAWGSEEGVEDSADSGEGAAAGEAAETYTVRTKRLRT